MAGTYDKANLETQNRLSNVKVNSIMTGPSPDRHKLLSSPSPDREEFPQIESDQMDKISQKLKLDYNKFKNMNRES